MEQEVRYNCLNFLIYPNLTQVRLVHRKKKYYLQFRKLVQKKISFWKSESEWSEWTDVETLEVDGE